MIHRDGNLPDGTRIIGTGRHPWDREDFVRFADERAQPFVDARYLDAAKWQAFLQRLDYVSMDASRPGDYAALAAALRDEALRIYYMAMPPGLFAATCDNLAGHGLIAADTRLVLEKPLGVDLASAIAISEVVTRYFSEARTYRIDHYLGKETVQNLMALRFGNSIFEPLWRTPFVSSVQITVAETVGVGSRGGFYDEAGAMRDMVQNHLLQLVSILAMEPPASLDSDSVRDENSRCCARCGRCRPRTCAAIPCAADIPRAQLPASWCAATCRKTASRPIAAPRPSWRCARNSARGAGTRCRSTCAPASACRSA